MKVTILSDADTWKNHFIKDLAATLKKRGHTVRWVHEAKKIPTGDVAFFLGCTKIVPPAYLKRNTINLVVHESALPKGRGWSPLSWQVLEGKNRIPLTLFEAVERVDAGRVFIRDFITLKGHELLAEIQYLSANKINDMCLRFMAGYPGILRKGKTQNGKPTYYPRRTADDSRLDARKSLASQFNLFRIANNRNYPVYFDWKGYRFILEIRKKPK